MNIYIYIAFSLPFGPIECKIPISNLILEPFARMAIYFRKLIIILFFPKWSESNKKFFLTLPLCEVIYNCDK